MNITLQLPDDLCEQVRQRADQESKSFASWVIALLLKELHRSAAPRRSLVEMLGDSEYLDLDIPLADRKQGQVRQVSLE